MFAVVVASSNITPNGRPIGFGQARKRGLTEPIATMLGVPIAQFG